MDASKLAGVSERGILRLADGSKYSVERVRLYGNWFAIFGSIRSDSAPSAPRCIIVNDATMRDWFIDTYRQPRNTAIVIADDVDNYDAPVYRVNHDTALREYAEIRKQADAIAHDQSA